MSWNDSKVCVLELSFCSSADREWLTPVLPETPAASEGEKDGLPQLCLKPPIPTHDQH